MGDDDASNLAFDETSQPMDVDDPGLVINPEDECLCQSESCRDFSLSHQLDTILDPGLIFSTPNQPERVWTILAHGHQDSADYIEKLNEYRVESHCGLAWPPGYVAYRCRTCSVALTMSLCAECFRAGKHEGHDYNMFKSRSGGACDCGYDTMKSTGHCSNHGRNAKAPRSHEAVPKNLTCPASRAIPRMMSRLVIQLRRQAVCQTMETDIYLDCLTNIANSSAILRNLMIQVILSESAYSSQTQLLSHHPDSRISKIVRESQKILKRERKKLVAFRIPPTWTAPTTNINAFCDKPPHKTFLEELVFWMVVYEFHQKLVCFLLGFLMDDSYKEVFSRLFVNYYPNIAVCLTNSPSDPRRPMQDSFEHLSRRLLQVSVQIYNDDELTRTICDEEMTLHALIYCLRVVIEGSQPDGIFSALKPNPLCQHNTNAPKVVCCDTPILRDRQLTSFTEDLLAILSFEHQTKRLLSDKNLLQVWLEMLSYFQTMSPYKRELNEHAPYENGPRQSVFMIESEFCLVPLWTMLEHLKDTESIAHTSQLLESIHANLASWLYRMSIGPHSKLDTYFMSFHIPLHRMLAATIRHLIYEQGVPEGRIFDLLSQNQSIFGSKFSYKSAHGARVTIKIDDFFQMLILHPLQALTLYHQTRSGMWTRNGILTVNQAITYVHCAYCYSIIDMDMFLLRYCASRLKADIFLKSFLQKFYAWHCLSFTCGPIFSDTPSDTLKVHYYFNIQPEQITQMVESCLITLIQLLTLSNHCNISSRDQTKQEMISLISVADRSYSYLVDMIPSISEQQKDDEVFLSLLDELTVYKPASHGAGGNLHQGCYTLKPEIWENDYDPVHILYRYYHRRDHQQSLDRFFQHAKSTGKLNRRSHSSALWPPLKIPKKVADFNPIDLSPLVRCQTLLGVIFSILYKCIYVEEMPDSMMAYTIHLLELSLRSQLEISSIGEDMDRDPDALKNDAVRFTKSTSFVGRYSYRELISYYENMPKDEALLKGRTIYSLFTEEPSGPDPHENVKLFPFVKHALDLAFDTTWFPFDSVIDNCLVHIETVHSLPRDEFDAMIQCANNDRTENESIYDECLYATTNSDRTSEQNLPDMSTTSSTRSTESQTATWSNLVGLEVEEIDDIEVIEVDDEEEDELEVDDILNSDDLNERIDDVDETSEIELSMVNQPDANEAPQGVSSPSASVSLTNSVTTTPTLSFERYTGNAQVDARQATTNPETEPSPVRERDLQGYIRMGDYRDAVRRLEAQRGVTSDNFASAIIHLDRMSHASGQSASSSISSVTRNSTTRQLHTSHTASAQQSRDGSSRHIGEISPRPEQPSQQIVHAQNLITERRAILDAQPRRMITNPPQPLALEATSSAPSLSTEMSTNTASTSTTNQDLQAQSMPQNGSNPTSQIATRFSTNVSQALEELTANLTESTGRHHHHASNQRERSLTEIDIHARFIGFFHSDTTSSSRTNPSRLMPRRQTARRGNYRGAYLIEPYLPYMNPNNTNTTTNNNNNNNNATANNNNNNNNSYNNNNSETVQELVRRSAAVIPAITNAVRSTIQQTVQRVENLETAQSSMTAHSSVTERARNERADESSPSSSPSPPLSSRAAGRAIVTPRRQVPIRSSSGWTGQQVPASFHMVNRFNASRSHQQQIQQDQRSRRLRKEHRQHHGESIMTLLLRLHAKYSQRPRSYHYDECRAQTNLDPSKRCKIGDGTHFVTIVLDLICTSDVKIRQRVDYLMELIWPKPANEKIGEKGWLGVGCLIGNEKDLGGETSLASCDGIELDTNTSKACRSSCASTGARTMPVGTPLASTSHSHMSASMKLNANSMDSMALLTPEEKRHRAKERQTRLMAEFANKQRAFMEKYAASTSSGSTSNATRSGSHSSTSTSTTSTMAHAQGVVTANSSNLALRIDGRETPNAHVRYEEQPINLSSKSNQEHARLSQSTPIAANNGPKTDCKPLSDAHDSDHKYGAQSITPNVNSSFVTQDTRKDEGSDSSSLAAGSGKQQPSSSHEERVQLQTSRANSAFDPANDALRDASLYECCICGVEGLSDSTNPLGQVVLLQSTSVHGHSHLRSRDERKLPCDESSHLSLKEETYAKYLERRIDVLCEHFKESSWLDAINIGAEGGVHVQSCGHHLHIDCHQSYIRSLDQEDGLRGRNDSDEFQCPVCRQLANSVLPILNDDFFLDTKRLKTTRPFSPTSKSTQTSTGLSTTEVGDNPLAKPSDDFTTGQSSPFQSKPPVSSSLTPRESMDDQIAQIGLQLRTRQAPNQQELQSSAIFCAHLTKATGPQYRLVRTTASMHSLFLFLSSIARTNLETSLIARSIKPQVQHERAALNRTDQQAGVFKLEDQRTQHCSTDSGFQPAMKRDKGKRSCFQLLFHVLALNAQTLISSQWCTYDHIWSHLTHSVPETNRLSIRPRDSEVPLLLRDPVAMLLQFLFTVIGSKSHELAHFTCLVRILFNLTVIQSTALVLSYVRSVPQLRPDESHSKSSAESFEGARVDQSAEISRDHALKRNKQQDEFDENDQRFLGLEKLLWTVLTNLGPLLARGRDEPLMNSVVRNSWPRLAGQLEQDIWRVGEPNQQDGQRQFDEHENRSAKLEFIENKIKLACLPFLRAAAFLHEHLYGGPGVSLLCELDEDRLSDPPSVDYDFSQLIQCLELAPPESLFVQHRSRQAKTCKERLKVEEGAELEASIKYQTFEPITLHQTLNWPSSAGPTGQNLVASWAAELIEFARERSIAARTLLLSRPLAWYRPALMQLPHAFDDIFMFYYRRKCSLCQQVPKDVAVCLVCGAPICFRASCCKDRSRSRQVHSQHCGANTAVFLAVHTSAVVVIRGNRACVWGSVYLDAHDEEDNGLQRGKPLYMVPARFALLETQWLTHSFDHTCGKRWIYLQEAQ